MYRKRTASLGFTLCGILFISLTAHVAAQNFNDIELEPHNYYSREFNDPMTKLLQARERGEADLGTALGKEGVARLLKELDIPVESQVLVFSKTSLQKVQVNPKNPRAVYFNEDVYVGWMPGGRVEIASMDPEAGAVLYFEDQRTKPSPPNYTKARSCIGCHAGSATNFLPGLLGRSTMTDEFGRSRGQIRSHEVIDHDVPIVDRWGGWYVSGHHGDLRHMANSTTITAAGVKMIDRESGANQETLEKYFDGDIHLRPDSDIVAMLVMDHQIGAHNMLMEALYRMRNELHKTDGKLVGKANYDAKKQSDKILKYFLFANESPLPESGVRGAGDFEKVFLTKKQAASDGTSLRDFYLKGRIFKHRCSYMIHSKAFKALPPIFKDLVLDKLHAILTAEKPLPGYEHLSDEERGQILKILKETLEGGFPRN